MTGVNKSEAFSQGLSEDHCFSFSELIDVIKTERHVNPNFPDVQLKSTLSMPRCVPLLDASLKESPVSQVNNANLDLEAFLNHTGKRKRNKKADPATWTKTVNRTKRMKGESYYGFDVVKTAGEPTSKSKYVFGKHRSARVMGSKCRSTLCEKRVAYCCSEFTEENRTEIFEYFWTKLDWKQKKSYVLSLIDVVPVKRRRKESMQRRNDTLVYCLKLNERRVQVCRNMFLSTLALGVQQVLHWVKMSNSGIPRNLGKIRRQPVLKEATKHVHQFLDQLPTLPSHYCRRSTSKLYLETHITTKAQVLQMYYDYCSKNDVPRSGRTTFNMILDKKNIGIFSPRKDRCDLCVGYENGQVAENKYNQHCHLKNLAREQKTLDKRDALEGMCHVLTMDLQAVKLSPVLNASSLYYKTKLMSHNFTVFNLKTKDAVCYWWNETEADLSSSTFASCLIDYIKVYLQDTLPVIIYSDGCVSQNRNVNLSNALLELAVSQNRITIQKFLEKGHTQMECDSVHSVIEAALKNKWIYTPDDYLEITRKARLRQPYIVKDLDHTFFKDYSRKENKRYSSIRPGVKKGDACVTDIKNIKYHPSGKIQYKLSYEQSMWTDLIEQPRAMISKQYLPLFLNRRKISGRKYKDLQDLKTVIPEEHHSFYNEIPHDE